ncbi:peptidase M14 [Bacteroidia bacterium]|nr:peptidase M14 [Bacteroidia bacterium]
MKKVFVVLFLFLSAASLSAQDEYYFGGRGKLNPAIPTPESFFGFTPGQALVRYDKVVEYFRLLAEKSDRAALEVFGLSYEGREQVALIVTAPANLKNLEAIRVEHLKVVNPAASLDVNSQKVIVHLGYNVHGGEIAGTDASVLAAYYFVASEDPDIVQRLGEAVVLIEPALNPDGRDRAATFINGFHSLAPVADPLDRGHSGGFVPHRGNHFFNDLNRDWLPLSQPESRNRVAYYHKWYPNVYLDYHEMGGGSTYYFEPSPQGSWSPGVPQTTYSVLHNILAKHFSQALNGIGSLYYTKETFTNFSPIYGSTYPDFEGGAGTTLEVGATSGVEIETEAGIRTFAHNLRDNFEISVAALRAATNEKATFLNHQKDFFKSALTDADKQAEKYIVFGSKEDRSITNILLHHLLQHHIEVYELTAPFSQGDRKFEAGSAYVVPFRQAHYRILNAIFEETTKFNTTVFMDISAPSTAQGFGAPYVKVKATVKQGALVTKVPEVKGAVSARSNYAYAFEYFDYLAPKALYYLQKHGVKARVAQKAFTARTTDGEKSYVPGAIVIPVHYQTVSPDELYRLLGEAAALANITVSAITDGFSVAGIDIGSDNIRVIKKPVVATVTGGSGYSGVNWTNVGELWALLSNTYNIPLTKVDYQAFERADLTRYTAIVLTGSLPFSKEFVVRLTDWVERGGTLLATGTAAQWTISNKIATGFPADSARNRRSAEAADIPPSRGGGPAGERLTGAIFNGELNLSHTLAYGFTSKDFYVLKTSINGLPAPTSPDNIVLKTASGEPVNGYVPAGLTDKLKNSPVVVATNRGRGAVVLFGESPTFRGYYLAPGRLLTNALFFGIGTAGPREY